MNATQGKDTMYFLTHNAPQPECSAVEFAREDYRRCEYMLRGAHPSGVLCDIALIRRAAKALTAYRRALRETNSTARRGGWH